MSNPLALLFLLLSLIGPTCLWAQTNLTSHSCVEKGMAIEINGSIDNFKDINLDVLAELIKPATSDKVLADTIVEYKKNTSKQEKLAIKILKTIAADVNVYSSSTKKISLSYNVASFIYIEILERKFTFEHIPIALLNCRDETIIRWSLSDDSHIDWNTKTGKKILEAKTCAEVKPGDDAFYALFYFSRGNAKANLAFTAELPEQKTSYYNEAVAEYGKAIQYDLKNATFYYARGNAERLLKDFTGAIADYSAAIGLDPVYADAYFNKANAELVLTHNDHRITKEAVDGYTQSVADYDKTIELDAKNADAVKNRDIAKAYLKAAGKVDMELFSTSKKYSIKVRVPANGKIDKIEDITLAKGYENFFDAKVKEINTDGTFVITYGGASFIITPDIASSSFTYVVEY